MSANTAIHIVPSPITIRIKNTDFRLGSVVTPPRAQVGMFGARRMPLHQILGRRTFGHPVAAVASVFTHASAVATP